MRRRTDHEGDLALPDERYRHRSVFGCRNQRHRIFVSLLSAKDATLSLGGAVAFEDGRAPRREAMTSLKVPGLFAHAGYLMLSM
jgi:hypothetical protein